jgi:hypothetical protein
MLGQLRVERVLVQRYRVDSGLPGQRAFRRFTDPSSQGELGTASRARGLRIQVLRFGKSRARGENVGRGSTASSIAGFGSRYVQVGHLHLLKDGLLLRLGVVAIQPCQRAVALNLH